MAGYRGATPLGALYHGAVKLGAGWTYRDGQWVQVYSSTFFYDDFERAAMGNKWVTLPGYSGFSIANGNIYSPSGQRKMYPDMVLPPATDNQRVGFTVGVGGTADVKGTIHMCADITPDAADFRSYSHLNFSHQGWNIGYRGTNGGYSGPLTSGTWTLAAGDVIEYARDDVYHYVMRNGRTERTFRMDAAPRGPGYRRTGVTLNPSCPRPADLWIKPFG